MGGGIATLLCPVRGCGSPLSPSGRAYACPRGHSFDRARSGYLNLLQPQDRRSRHPGDPREAALARRRLFQAGFDAPLLELLSGIVGSLPLPARPDFLDVGCGEGSMLAALARVHGAEAHGVDISTPAIDLAARAFPEATWVVANADRFLPWAPGSFQLTTSLTARLNGPELRRVLAPHGWLLIAVPGPDDLIELREAVLGRGELRERLGRAEAALDDGFQLERRHLLRYRVRPGPAELADLLLVTYRGGRPGRQERLAVLAGREVTTSRDLGLFRPRP